MIRGLSGNDTLSGGLGNDNVYGGAGQDHLNGDNGNDNMHGDNGADTLTGGGLSDTFVFSTGNDVVTDFDTLANRERVDLSDVAEIVDFADLSADHMTETAGGVVIADGLGNSLTLTGVALADLSADHFDF